jgi:hypothetical protein
MKAMQKLLQTGDVFQDVVLEDVLGTFTKVLYKSAL